MSDGTFRAATLVKQASAQDKRHAVIHTSWKLELIERQKKFMQLVCERGLPALQDDQQYLKAIFAKELDDLDVANEQYRQFTAHSRKRVTPFANSSDTEHSPDEFMADDDSHSSSGSHSDGGLDDLIYGVNE
ncbi:uncharacterized protein F5147DRAFT_659499 [Suillus discolor]|uniref:Uncharacterized protein n=1 Tax=Suillus discolor TaxID=1912936 RepID=A0A9P7EQY6_9AGAM|nr:uncharacterized protein F5147DRAFT_659499 [Suillus discolor]KAG2085469.1 hypothetical protein F5147DRAFT_659499 [Suillus discolor]